MTKDPALNRDPSAKKARDNARQRKIATNGSSKASRKNAPLIKARANRTIRRADRQILSEQADTFEESADKINIAHAHKPKTWGSDNAALHRAIQKDVHENYRQAGGRKAVQAAAWREIRGKIDSKAVVDMINEQLSRLKKTK